MTSLDTPTAQASSQASHQLSQKLPDQFKEMFIEIIRKTSAELPQDVIDAVLAGKAVEEEHSRAEYALGIIEKNIHLSKLKSQPLCQDTGSILWYVHYPHTFDHEALGETIKAAVSQATEKGYLRQNSVDSLTGKNNGTNVGPGTPTLHLEPWKKEHFDIRLILKGGGCENVGAQYSLPDSRIGAGRDIAGVKRCILDAVQQAQGKGCGPGVLGVVIGGDRATGYAVSKEQFLRKMEDKSPNPVLAELEEECTKEANKLGIGPMGFGGKTTLLGVKAAVLNRLPASFFVSVSYMCWAYRRQGAHVDAQGTIKNWFY
jgi:fumarate hydratase class I